MNSSKYERSQLKELCSIIKSTPMIVKLVTDSPNRYYREWVEEKYDKLGNLKKYKDGTIKKRTIMPPLEPLFSVQSRIKDNVLAKISLPDNIHGGVKGRTNITNAKPHQGKSFVFTTDLQDFFPGISPRQVLNALLKQGLSHHKAHWLTKLMTYKYQVPQGSPTSSHLANIVFLDVDYKLIELCSKHDVTYTRYVDDLTFSSATDFQSILHEILSVVINGGFKISRRKTLYKGRQLITGIEVFNNYIDAPEKIIKKVDEEAKSIDPNKPYFHYLKRIRNSNK